MEPQTSKAPIHSSPYQGEAGWGFSYAQPPKKQKPSPAWRERANT